jgi:exodeoxyribonuclease VII large subunit
MAESLETTPETASGKIYSVGQYNRSLERLLKAQVPVIWVKGVITQLQVRGKVAYFTLGEFEEGDAKPKAVLDVILWAWQFDDFNARFAQLPTPFALKPDLKVSFLLEPNFYVPTGRFQPRVVDVDEAFTLGELSLTRQKILERLVTEGLIERNKKLSLTDIPLRVGLITATGSAAYKDFTTVLLQSGYSFDIRVVSARMQGAATEETVTEALETLAKLPLDVICLVRGGGSKTDLVFFDSEKICRAIATCPIPVLTGIGHEIDRSLADVVAYADLITPTDCAKFLEGRVQDAWSALQRKASELRGAWQWTYQQSGYDAVQRAQELRTAWDNRALRESIRQSDAFRQMTASAVRLFQRSREALSLGFKGLSRGPAKIYRAELQALELKEKLVQAADPVSLLRRGFAQVFSVDGKWLRGVDEVSVGDDIRVRLADGEVRSRVQGKESKAWDPRN